MCDEIRVWAVFSKVASAPVFGLEKAYALIRYAAATPADDVAATLAASNARIGGKSVRTATLRELVAATRRIAARRSSRDPELRAARRRAGEAERAARGKGAEGAVVTARRQGGRIWLRIEVPADEADVLLPRAKRERGR